MKWIAIFQLNFVAFRIKPFRNSMLFGYSRWLRDSSFCRFSMILSYVVSFDFRTLLLRDFARYCEIFASICHVMSHFGDTNLSSNNFQADITKIGAKYLWWRLFQVDSEHSCVLMIPLCEICGEMKLCVGIIASVMKVPNYIKFNLKSKVTLNLSRALTVACFVCGVFLLMKVFFNTVLWYSRVCMFVCRLTNSK